MAKSNWGITSGFIGKLGNVVGFNWKGKNIQRALIPAADPRTEAQLLQRGRFKTAGQLGSVLYDAVYEGFRHEARSNRSTQSGLFLKHNLAAINGTDPASLAVDYPELQLSYGKLKGVECSAPAISGTTLSVTVTNTAALNRRTALNDRVYVCAYCPALEDAVCQSVGTRSGGEFTLTVPAGYADKTVYVYAFVIGASSTNEGQASTTIYLGTVGSGSSAGSETGSSTGSSTGSETGGGQTVTVAAPTISGTTPFAETTQVTMSAESGAEIRYTTDGSTPTSSSTLYSAALTLSDTTTVKAIAIKSGTSSSVASQTFTKSSGGGGTDPEDGDVG